MSFLHIPSFIAQQSAAIIALAGAGIYAGGGRLLLRFDIIGFIAKFIKFCIVGFTCMLIDFGITFVGKEKLKVSKYVANAAGFAISATTNYFLNRAWTFRNSDPNVVSQYLRFIIIAFIGLGINTGVLYFFHHKRKQNFYVSKLLATGVTVFWNFLGNTFFTFS